MKLGEAKDAPSGQRRFQILLGVCGEPLRTIVVALNPDSTLDLDERPTLDVGEVRAPSPRRMKGELALQIRSAQRLPVEQKPSLLAGWRFFVAVAKTHPSLFLSIQPPICRRADDTMLSGMKKIEEIAAQVFAAIGFGLTFVFVLLFVAKVIWWALY